LLVAVDTFCDRASRKMEKLPAPASTAPAPRVIYWRIAATVVVLCGLGAGALFLGFLGPKTSSSPVQAADPVPVKAPPVAAKIPPTPPVEPAPSTLKLDIRAKEAAWVSVYENDKTTFATVMEPGQTRTIESSAKIRLQLGNAGGVELAVNGKPSGSLGHKGQVRVLEVRADGLHPLR